MNKKLERLKKDLIEITDAINSFRNENVQIIVTDRVLTYLNARNNGEDPDNEGTIQRFEVAAEHVNKRRSHTKKAHKKMGATKIVNHLLSTDFFEVPRSISGISDCCSQQYNTDLRPSEISGLLLSLVKKNKLVRQVSEVTNRYVYLKATAD